MLGKIFLILLLALGLYTVILVVQTRHYLAETEKLKDLTSDIPTTYTTSGTSGASTYVVLGDSTGVGVGLTNLKQTLGYTTAASASTSASVSNFAITGARLHDVLVEQLPKVPKRSNVVIVSISGNDATHLTTENTFRADLELLLTGLTESGTEKILLTTTPSFTNTPALPALIRLLVVEKATSLSELIRTTTKQYPAVRVVDLHSKGVLSAQEYASDGFHPSAKGYENWAKLFVEANR
jgi:lysophospholipase L1-like esterase